MRNMLLVLVITFISACTVSPKQYEGEVLPLDQLAVIKTKRIRIQYIDGESLGMGQPTKIYHLKPGYHELGFIYSGQGTSWNRVIVGVELQKGKTYKLNGTLHDDWTWTYKFTEGETGVEVGKALEKKFNW